MKAIYQLKFESETQREALEAALQELGIPFRVLGDELLAEELGADYNSEPEMTPEFRAYAMHEIQLGLADAAAGNTVPWEEVNRKLEKRLARYRNNR